MEKRRIVCNERPKKRGRKWQRDGEGREDLRGVKKEEEEKEFEGRRATYTLAASSAKPFSDVT